jgi:hypothetical protein
MCLLCPARVPNITTLLNRLRMGQLGAGFFCRTNRMRSLCDASLSLRGVMLRPVNSSTNGQAYFKDITRALPGSFSLR